MNRIFTENWICECEEFFAKIEDHHFLSECFNNHERLYGRLVFNQVSDFGCHL